MSCLSRLVKITDVTYMLNAMHYITLEITSDVQIYFSICNITNYVVLRHTLPVFTGLGRCPIVNWDFAGAVSIFGPDALPVVHQ